MRSQVRKWAVSLARAAHFRLEQSLCQLPTTIRRFLIHVLPKGLHRIRPSGFSPPLVAAQARCNKFSPRQGQTRPYSADDGHIDQTAATVI